MPDSAGPEAQVVQLHAPFVRHASCLARIVCQISATACEEQHDVIRADHMGVLQAQGIQVCLPDGLVTC